MSSLKSLLNISMYQRLLTINYWVQFEWVTQIINSLTDFFLPVLFVKIQNLIFPQRFFQPIFWEAHCLYVNHGEICQQLFQMTFHIIMWWYYINEPFDDANVVKNTIGRYIRRYPVSFQFFCNHRPDRIFFIPYSRMMTTWVSCKCNDCHPWGKYGRG